MKEYDGSFNNDINEEILRLDNNKNYESENELQLDSVSSFESEISVETLVTGPGLFSLACTNARSIVEKISSLVTLFEECDLHVALLTETWLTARSCSKRQLEDLTTGANVSFIRRDRGCLLYTSDAADE